MPQRTHRQTIMDGWTVLLALPLQRSTTDDEDKEMSDIKECLKLIDRLFGDTSVPKETTLEWMEKIAEKAESNADALRDELRDE